MTKWYLIVFFLFSFFDIKAQNFEYNLEIKNITSYVTAKENAKPIKELFPNKGTINSKILFDPENSMFKIISNVNYTQEFVKTELYKSNLELITFIRKQ